MTVTCARSWSTLGRTGRDDVVGVGVGVDVVVGVLVGFYLPV